MSPEIPIYGGKSNMFSDNTNMLLECKITNTNATTGSTFTLEGRVGTGGLLKNVYIIK